MLLKRYTRNGNPFSGISPIEATLRFAMPVAFVLINAEIGSEDEVVVELRKISNVKESYVVYGVYDIVAKVEADSMDKLKEIVTWKIRRLDKVRSTLTMIVVEGT
jgi:DNA-binding Lrp family transcriptional regulator